jgi:tRNA(Leu) C34 or U34 (ribose-2'-O)-methylase TrmL
MSRGYSMIAVDRPKDTNNFAGLMRAGHCYSVAGIVLAGERYDYASANTTKAERHIPLYRVADVFDCLPYDCVPVAVDLLDDATPLPQYIHPERAFYIFGAEDGTLGARITDRCRDKVYVPTSYCMNLAATANVILYDRLCKRQAISKEMGV